MPSDLYTGAAAAPNSGLPARRSSNGHRLRCSAAQRDRDPALGGCGGSPLPSLGRQPGLDRLHLVRGRCHFRLAFGALRVKVTFFLFALPSLQWASTPAATLTFFSRLSALKPFFHTSTFSVTGLSPAALKDFAPSFSFRFLLATTRF